MNNQDLTRLFTDLATPQIADACVRLHLPLIIAPPGISSVLAGTSIAGNALPAQHYGSVDIFLEAMESAQPGDILVIDNQGRTDESCIGDLTVLEARDAGLAGLIVWGFHRDTAELWNIGMPVFSYGTNPAGPVRLDECPPHALEFAQFGPHTIRRGDGVFADEDGVIFVAQEHLEAVLSMARTIWEKERQQAIAVQEGRNLRTQLRFREYLTKRAADPTYSFRAHLRILGGAIEE